MRTVLFYRDFEGFTGGHLKVWDYFNHVRTAPGHTARIHFSVRSRWDETNPWLARRDAVLPGWDPDAADGLFLAGMDWEKLPSAPRERLPQPVLNLIQHVRHADPADPRFRFLRHRAVRICVSEPVRDALASTGRVNGPLVVIPNGVDLAAFPVPVPPEDRAIGLLICGLKQAALASELAAALGPTLPGGAGQVETLDTALPRPQFLKRLASARRAVFLPHRTEGFYLPALEAMQLQTLVLCPDCVGNRTFCRDGETALVPATFDLPGLRDAVARALALEPAEEARIKARATDVAAAHSLTAERMAFHRLLAGLDDLW